MNRAAFHSLLAKLRLAMHLLVAEAHVVARAVAGGQGEAQRVGAVLVDDLQRVDAVAQGFGHLAALRVPDQAVDEHGLEGSLPHVLEPEKIMRATQKKMMS